MYEIKLGQIYYNKSWHTTFIIVEYLPILDAYVISSDDEIYTISRATIEDGIFNGVFELQTAANSYRRILTEDFNALTFSQRVELSRGMKYLYVGHEVLVFYKTLEDVKDEHRSNVYEITKDGDLKKIKENDNYEISSKSNVSKNRSI